MSPRQALTSALHLFVVFAFFLAGFAFVSLPYLPKLKTEIFEQSTLIGLSLFIISLVLLLGFYALDRGRYLVLQMGVSTDANVIQQSIEECLNRQFGKKISLSDVEVTRKSNLEIRVSLAPLDEAAREVLFVEAEKQLNLLLKERFGYHRPFRLVVKL